MTTRASEKIIDGLTQLMEGFADLQEAVEADFRLEEETSIDDDPSSEVSLEIDAAIVTEVRAAVEAVMEAEDYSPEEVAAFISTVTDALEEIDPDVFEEDEEEAIDEADSSASDYEEDDDTYYDEYDDLEDDDEDDEDSYDDE